MACMTTLKVEAPRLMIIPRKPLSLAAIENLRKSAEAAFTGPPKRGIVFPAETEARVFQLVEGRWEPLIPPDPPADEDKALEDFLATVMGDAYRR